MDWRGEKGSVVALALITIVVLMLLGFLMVQFSVVDVLHASRHEKGVQAHYIARGGAEAMASYMIANSARFNDEIEGREASSNGDLGDGSFIVSASWKNEDQEQVVVESTGTVDGISRTVYLTLNRITASMVFEQGLIQTSDDPLDLHNITVEGDVATAGEVVRWPQNEEDFNEEGEEDPDKYNIKEHQTFNFPSPIAPELQEMDSIDIGNPDDPAFISEDGYYPTIKVQNNDLTFDTGAHNNVMQVVVDDLFLYSNANVYLEGEGRLEIYVTNSADIQTPIEFNTDPPNPSRLVIYLEKDTVLEYQANSDFFGYIYGPEAKVGIQSGNTDLEGAVLAEVVVRSDNNDSGPMGNVIFAAIEEDFELGGGIPAYQRGVWSD